MIRASLWPRSTAPNELWKSTYSLPSTSQIREPWARVMNSGYGVALRPSPWTPPGDTAFARAKRARDAAVGTGHPASGPVQWRGEGARVVSDVVTVAPIRYGVPAGRTTGVLAPVAAEA